MVKNLPKVRETWVRSLGWEDLLEEGMANYSSILAWRISKNRGAWATKQAGWNRYCSGSAALITLMPFAFLPSLSHINLQCPYILCRHPAPPLWLRVMLWAHGILMYVSFPRGSGGKESLCSVGNLGLIPGLGRSPGGGPGNPLQYSCLENPHGQRNLEGYSPWGHKELDTTEQLSRHTHRGLPWWLSGEESAYSAGVTEDTSSSPGSPWSCGGGHGNPLQYSCLENPHRQMSLAGYSPWGCRVRHDWNDLACMHTHNTNRGLNSACVIECLN